MTKLTRIEELDHLLVESLRAAEMRQGCANHTYYAEIIRKQICQLFPQPLDDKELREKIVKVVCETCHSYEKCKHSTFPQCYNFTDKVDQILALLQPKIEEAKREERERIIKEIEGHACLGEANYTQTVLLKGEILINPGYLWWQALKRKE